MSDLDAMVNAYVARLSGPMGDDAFHALLELGSEVLPQLLDAFHESADQKLRSDLVGLAWRTRSEAALPLLAEALVDRAPQVWRQALDGLVALGGRSAHSLLSAARGAATPDKLGWINEALDQLREDGWDEPA